MNENDVWGSADKMIQLYADKAAIRAAMIADKMLVRKDDEGHEIWKRITYAIRELEGRLRNAS